ncbi:MAG: SMC-Scp complex subunit ScpB [Oscillospiraceae bacterium]|nr:SMC-Scp complex subunit ScpB [Oscillospiraceae bacterium]MDD4413881.1 SMC-Scp complex subunit ScpB [Oscillospiraceae bacterium]
MEINEYKAITQAVLFSSGEPVELSRLAEVIELDEDTTERIADELMNEVNTGSGGLIIVRLDNCYQMSTKPAYAEYIRKALDIRRNMPLSQAAMEVLAIVAYNQPVTRAYIDQVRGVDCAAVIQGLVAKNLIEEKGRLELPGRPLLYGTTVDFLRCFGVSSLDELPPLPQSEEEMQETTLDEIIEDVEKAEIEQALTGDEKGMRDTG